MSICCGNDEAGLVAKEDCGACVGVGAGAGAGVGET